LKRKKKEELFNLECFTLCFLGTSLRFGGAMVIFSHRKKTEVYSHKSRQVHNTSKRHNTIYLQLHTNTRKYQVVKINGNTVTYVCLYVYIFICRTEHTSSAQL